MEQHPVPRNISGFQFHLIGDMTLRQFAYLAGGVISAFLLYKITPFPNLIKYSLMAMAAFVGLAFAFLPIQDRPLDRWLIAFTKSVFSPTQYVWQKEGILPEILAEPAFSFTKKMPQKHVEAHRDAREKLRAYLKTLPSSPHQALNVKEKNYIDKTLALFSLNSVFINPLSINTNNFVQPKTSLPLSTPSSLTPTVQTLTKPASHIDEPSIEEKDKPLDTDIPSPQTIDTSSTYQEQLKKMTLEKELLTRELTQLKNEFESFKEPTVIKPMPAKDQEPTITTINPHNAINEVGLPKVPQTPNIVMGVIKDAQKKILPNIIITIKDNKGIPLRALKTNKLGQFMTATPLPNGTYLLEIEDPLKRFVFDIAQITLSGKSFLPIEIIAKGVKEIMREKLSKELFGFGNANI